MTLEAVGVPTVASTWEGVAGGPITDQLLDWPPDVFALANVVLGRSEAFRFALSPPEEWPPRRYPDWAGHVQEAAVRWGAWAEDRRGSPPDLVLELWHRTFIDQRTAFAPPPRRYRAEATTVVPVAGTR